MRYSEKITDKIAENLGKIVFGQDYKLEDLCIYPNAIRMTSKRSNKPYEYLNVEFEGLRIYKAIKYDDFIDVSNHEAITIAIYLQKTIGLKLLMPDYLKK